MDRTNNPNVLSLLLTTTAVVVTVVYLLVAFNTQDALWFTSKFDESPTEVNINCYGEEIVLVPGEAQYNALVPVINEVLSGSKNWDSLTMSADTYSEYKTTDIMMIMELHYNPPVRIHSNSAYFSKLSSIIIPLDGRHARTNAIFGTIFYNPSSGSMHFSGIPDIRSFVEENGICSK